MLHSRSLNDKINSIHEVVEFNNHSLLRICILQAYFEPTAHISVRMSEPGTTSQLGF